MRAKILLVEGNVDGTIGGSFYSLLFLVKGLDKRRFAPSVLFNSDNKLIPQFESAGAKVIVMTLQRPTRRGIAMRLLAKAESFVKGYVLEPLRLARLIRREGFDLVHLNNSILRNQSWIMAAALARVPCITHERGINRAFPARTRLLARGFRAIVCISSAVTANLRNSGFANLPLVQIPNGLDAREMRVTRTETDVRQELGVAPGARLVGIVGNLRHWKGQHVVVEAMRRVCDRYPHAVCLLIGDFTSHDEGYRQHIQRLVRELGLEQNIHITGFRSNVADYINAIEVLVHASVEPEPFGRVLLEGMALAKPLVASNGGAVPEIVNNGVTGLLFQPGNAVQLADSLLRLFDDSSLAAKMGSAGRKRLLSEFSIESNTKRTQELYDRILGSSGKGNSDQAIV